MGTYGHDKKRSWPSLIADGFAATVLAASLLFIVLDSVYLIRHYVPILLQKVRSWDQVEPIEEDVAPTGSRNYYYNQGTQQQYGSRDR